MQSVLGVDEKEAQAGNSFLSSWEITAWGAGSSLRVRRVQMESSPMEAAWWRVWAERLAGQPLWRQWWPWRGAQGR